MDYLLTEEQKMIKDLARQIAVEKIKPVAAEYDEKEEFPWPIVKIIAESDLFGIYIPEEYGGMGGGVLDLAIATEDLSGGCGGIALAYAATGGPRPTSQAPEKATPDPEGATATGLA